MRRVDDLPFRIEAIDGSEKPDVVHLAGADSVALQAFGAIEEPKGVTRFSRFNGVAKIGAGVPTMVVAVADLRSQRNSLPALLQLRQREALTVAVVLVTALDRTRALDALAKHFDAVVLVQPTRGVDAIQLLTSAIEAVTGFATGDRISMAVDDVYPFYARRGSRLHWGYGESDLVEDAAEKALRLASIDLPSGQVDVLLHLDAFDTDAVRSLRVVGDVVRRSLPIRDISVSVSSLRPREGSRVSVVLSPSMRNAWAK